MTSVHVVQHLDAAAALLSEPRLRILGELGDPDSSSGVARRIGLPRQQVNYHLRELEKSGLVEFVEERRKGNCVERVVRASARSYLDQSGGAWRARPDSGGATRSILP